MKYFIVSIALVILMLIILIFLLPFYGDVTIEPPYSYILTAILLNFIISAIWTIRKDFVSAVKELWDEES